MTSSTSQEHLASLLQEDRTFAPPPEFREKANIQDADIWKKAAQDIEGYWSDWAEKLHWFKKWDKVLEWSPPNAKWFVGGKTNLSYNCLDRHIKAGKRNVAALIWEGEPGDKRVITYWGLYLEVNQFANALKKLGVKKGDRVAIYLPMIPEIVVSMLACARIGAIHTVVFGGFSAESLADRINDCGCKVLITADGGYRRGTVIPLKHDADYAIKNTPTIEHVVIVKRGDFPLRVKEGRDHWYHRLLQEADDYCEPEHMDSEDILYILYTSGTTGKPKGIVHTTGGYMVGTYATTQWVFDLKEDDVFWCTADCGWVTGHSYITYGPLANGATCLMYEGAPDWPDKDRFWDLIHNYGVTILYTAPTAIRTFMKWGDEYPQRHDLSTLRLLGTVGEPINPEAWIWYREVIGGGRCPVVDTWWQTETGAIMITTLPGISTTKPGYAGVPFPGLEAKILTDSGAQVAPGAGGGYVAITKPWPAMLRGIYGDNKRYRETYWTKWDAETYFPGDGAKQDEEGRFLFLGRVDDVLSVAGHRIGTSEVESALVDHAAVAEAAVVGKHHEVKGQVIAAFVILKASVSANDELEQELKEHVVHKIGAIARPEKIMFVADVPKTRSGKIMRRLLKDIADGKVLGDTTTLADASVVEQLKAEYEDKEG